MGYDYSKLRGLIREHYGTQGKFAKELGLSTVSLSGRLNNQLTFKQSEMLMRMKLLGEPAWKIGDIFYKIN
ncbi:MAG: DUF739 family protein [Eubacteriales bacterium]|nr:DUF739 family protein [Eubacteriales bacterium]